MNHPVKYNFGIFQSIDHSKWITLYLSEFVGASILKKTTLNKYYERSKSSLFPILCAKVSYACQSQSLDISSFSWVWAEKFKWESLLSWLVCEISGDVTNSKIFNKVLLKNYLFLFLILYMKLKVNLKNMFFTFFNNTVKVSSKL